MFAYDEYVLFLFITILSSFSPYSLSPQKLRETSNHHDPEGDLRKSSSLAYIFDAIRNNPDGFSHYDIGPQLRRFIEKDEALGRIIERLNGEVGMPR